LKIAVTNRQELYLSFFHRLTKFVSAAHFGASATLRGVERLSAPHKCGAISFLGTMDGKKRATEREGSQELPAM